MTRLALQRWKSLFPPLDRWEPGVVNWRHALLQLLLRVIVLIGPLVYVVSIAMCVTGRHLLIAVTDTVAMAIFIALYFLPRIPHRVRALVFSLNCYLLGAVLLIALGPISQIYLFGYSILTGLLLGLRMGLVSVAINGITLLVLGFSGAASPTMAAVWDQNPASWIVITCNFVMMNGLLVIGIGAIIKALETALAQQLQAREVAEARAIELRQANELLEREVEERVRTENALAASVERFRLLSRATTDAIWDLDLASGTMWWNEGFESMFGFATPGAAPGLDDWIAHVHPEDRDRVLHTIRDTLDGCGGQWTSEYRFQRKAGDYAHVLGRGHVIRGPGSEARRMVGGMTDLTARKVLEQQILRAQRLESIGTLAGGIAHDINNVLAPILIAADLLSAHLQDGDGSELVELVRGSAQRGADLVNQVLGFARGIEGDRRTVSLAEIVADLQKVLRDIFPRNIAIELNVPPESFNVNADPTQLHQVLMNLCLNARDAMPGGGQLYITLANVHQNGEFDSEAIAAGSGPFVMIQVEDTGTGMSAATQERIFEPFFTTKEVGKGSGLGLSTTFSIIRNHSGHIRIESELGRGTCFKVFLPAANGSVEQDPPSSVRTLQRGSNETILLVDDEASIRTATGRLLEHCGYRVLTAANGEEALSLYRTHQKDIAAVLTDMSMPVMDGPTMIAAMRQDNPELPIIASSGLGESLAKECEVGVEPSFFVSKPYSAANLLNTLAQALAGRHAGSADLAD